MSSSESKGAAEELSAAERNRRLRGKLWREFGDSGLKGRKESDAADTEEGLSRRGRRLAIGHTFLIHRLPIFSYALLRPATSERG